MPYFFITNIPFFPRRWFKFIITHINSNKKIKVFIIIYLVCAFRYPTYNSIGCWYRCLITIYEGPAWVKPHYVNLFLLLILILNIYIFMYLRTNFTRLLFHEDKRAKVWLSLVVTTFICSFFILLGLYCYSDSLAKAVIKTGVYYKTTWKHVVKLYNAFAIVVKNKNYNFLQKQFIDFIYAFCDSPLMQALFNFYLKISPAFAAFLNLAFHAPAFTTVLLITCHHFVKNLMRKK